MTALGPVADFRLRDIALAAYGPSALASIGAGAATPVIVLQARDLGASVATAAFVVALLGLGSLVTSLPAGALVARIGERMALVLAGIVDALAMAGAALSTSVGSLGVAVAVTGGAGTVFLLARQGFVIDAVPVSHRARALSALGGAHRSGLFFGPLIAGVGRPPHRGRQRAGVGGGDDPGRRHRPDRRPGPVSRRVAGGGWRLFGDLGTSVGPLLVSALAAVAPLSVACAVVGGVLGIGAWWVAVWTGRLDQVRRLERADIDT